MCTFNPMNKSKEEYAETIKMIRTESPVGIDAQLTHAIIIDYLQNLTEHVGKIEEELKKLS